MRFDPNEVWGYNLRANIQTFRTTVDTGDEVEMPARA